MSYKVWVKQNEIHITAPTSHAGLLFTKKNLVEELILILEINLVSDPHAA